MFLKAIPVVLTCTLQSRSTRLSWSRLRSVCFNQDVANEFYTYLLSLKPDELIALHPIPSTDLREEMINISKSNSLRFIDDVQSGDFPLAPHEVVHGKIGSRDLYQKYSDWCYANGERNKATQTKFSTIVKRELKHGRGTSGVYYCLALPQQSGEVGLGA